MLHLLEVEGGQLAYETYESAITLGPTLIFAPGIGDLRSEYRFLAPLLAAAGLRVVTTDLRGHGDSSAMWQEYSPEAVGRDLLALARHLGQGQPVLLAGCSMAAASAVWAAVEAPELVAGLLLLGPSLEDGELTVMQSVALQVAFVGPWKVRAWDMFYASLYPCAKPEDLDGHRSALRASLREPGRFAAVNGFIKASKSDCAARMESVRQPVLLIMGSQDPDYAEPAAIAQRWGNRLSAEVLVVTDSGHYPHVDAARAVAERTLVWVSEFPESVLVTRQATRA